jgi:hypothetical protein
MEMQILQRILLSKNFIIFFLKLLVIKLAPEWHDEWPCTSPVRRVDCHRRCHEP